MWDRNKVTHSSIAFQFLSCCVFRRVIISLKKKEKVHHSLSTKSLIIRSFQKDPLLSTNIIIRLFHHFSLSRWENTTALHSRAKRESYQSLACFEVLLTSTYLFLQCIIVFIILMQKYKTFCKMRNFQLLVKSNPVCFVFSLLCSMIGPKSLRHSQPIMCKSKTNLTFSSTLGKMVSFTLIEFSLPLNPLTPMSDQDRYSPCNINTILSRQVMKVKKNIN